MADSDRVLIDTSALYALHSNADLFHDRANVAFQDLKDTKQELWTTSYTLVETIALLHRRLGFLTVSEFSEWRRRSDIHVYWIDRRVHDQAWNRYMAEQGRGLSLVDWTTVVLSHEMRVPVFTFDGGFANQGLAVVPR